MKRHELSIRARTTQGQQLPPNWQQKQELFVKFTNDAIKERNVRPRNVVNMDEVPLSFDIPANRTVHTVGERTVPILTTGQ
jgi:hypothetical protein